MSKEINEKTKKEDLKPWSDLSSLTQGRDFYVERARLLDSGVALEGSFEIPELAKLSPADHAFVVAFIKTEGSIKDMEKLFGVSYPSIKARLSKISAQLSFVENIIHESFAKRSTLEVLDQISLGKISVEEALKLIRKEKLK